MSLQGKNGRAVGKAQFNVYVGRHVAGMASKIVMEKPCFKWGKGKWQNISHAQVVAIRSKYSRLKGDAEISAFILEHCSSLRVKPRTMQRLLLGFSRPFVFAKYGTK